MSVVSLCVAHGKPGHCEGKYSECGEGERSWSASRRVITKRRSSDFDVLEVLVGWLVDQSVVGEWQFLRLFAQAIVDRCFFGLIRLVGAIEEAGEVERRSALALVDVGCDGFYTNY